MKKIILLFAVTVLYSLTTQAQPRKYRDFNDTDFTNRSLFHHNIRNNHSLYLKSALYQQLDSVIRPDLYKEYYYYDNNKLNIQYIVKVKNEGNQLWDNSEKFDYYYDSNGNLLSMSGFVWNALSIQWILDFKYELTYANNLTSAVFELEWTANQWINSYKYEYTYDSNSNNTSEITYKWNPITTQWENNLKYEYSYDSFNRRILKLYWSWSDGIWSNTSKTTYSYDTSGNMNLYIFYDLITSTGTWLPLYKGEFTYDQSNRPLLTVHSISDDGSQWINNRKIDYTYSYTTLPSNLILPNAREFYYDEYIDITAASFTMQNWDIITSSWYITYTKDKYFSDFIIQTPILSVSTNTLTVEAPAESTRTIDITSNLNWTATSNESWLTLSSETGIRNGTITLTATANPATTTRMATVTVSATGVPSQTIIISQPALSLQVTVFLEGAYAGAGLMNTTLKAGALVPLSQPYNNPPWNYAGTETVASVPANVMDWVLVELRQAATPAEALPVTTTLPGWPKACLLKSDGSIVNPDGTTLPALGNPVITGNLYVIIRHRNHVAIMSAAGMTLTGSNYVYNFTDAVSKAHGGSAGYKEIGPGVFGMVSGDPDADGEISVLDFSQWASDFGKTTIYLPSDIDADGEVSVLDFTKWATNFGVGNIAPLKNLSLDGSGLKYRSQVPDFK